MEEHNLECDTSHHQHHPDEIALFNSFFWVINTAIWSLSKHHRGKAIPTGYLQSSIINQTYFLSTLVTLEGLERDYTLYCLSPTGSSWYDAGFRRGLVSWCAGLDICFFHLINVRNPHPPHPSTESLPPVQSVITTEMLNRTNKDLP